MLLNLSHKEIILASKSPRRQELLKGLDIDFKIITKEIEEIYPDTLDIRKVAEYLSNLKASAFSTEIADNQLVITSDTVVLLENNILGKPKDANHAKKMIESLSGKMHEVITGVTLLSKEKAVSFSSTTKVYFKNLSTEQINYYVDKYHPLDKAGSYGIQEYIGYVGIEKIDGCYYNVMGLPLQRLHDELLKFC